MACRRRVEATNVKADSDIVQYDANLATLGIQDLQFFGQIGLICGRLR
jgi:hypothetical protein